MLERDLVCGVGMLTLTDLIRGHLQLLNLLQVFRKLHFRLYRFLIQQLQLQFVVRHLLLREFRLRQLTLQQVGNQWAVSTLPRQRLQLPLWQAWQHLSLSRQASIVGDGLLHPPPLPLADSAASLLHWGADVCVPVSQPSEPGVWQREPGM